MAKKQKDIYISKKKRTNKAAFAFAAFAGVILIAAGGFFAAKSVAKAQEERAELGKCTWSTKGYEDIYDIKSLDEKIAVFTEKSGEKMGLMSLDGKVTQAAEYDGFDVCSDVWGSKKYVAEKGGKNNLFLVDVINGKVTERQYQGPLNPEKSVCWNKAANSLVWVDSKGYAGQVKKSEIGYIKGFFPVSTSLSESTKWGFADENLNIKITLTYDSVCEFSNGFAAVKNGDKWGYINEKEIIKISPVFESAATENVGGKDISFGFRNGLAPVKKDGKFGIIDKSGNTVVNFVFDKIIQGKDGKYLALKNGKWGLITVDEERVTETSAPAPETTYQQAVAYDLGEFKVKTLGSPLNLRRDPQSDSPVLRKIPDGTVVEVEKSASGWSFVEFDGVKGWVSTKYLQPVETK